MRHKFIEYTETAHSIAWDGCHKIYILQDQEQTDKMRDYGYDYLWDKSMMDADSMANTIAQWYTQSCPLRLVDSVSTGDYNQPDFTSVVSQRF